MSYIRIKFLDGNQTKLNLDKIKVVTFLKETKEVMIRFDDGTYIYYKEGEHIEDAKTLFNRFPS